MCEICKLAPKLLLDKMIAAYLLMGRVAGFAMALIMLQTVVGIVADVDLTEVIAQIAGGNSSLSV